MFANNSASLSECAIFKWLTTFQVIWHQSCSFLKISSRSFENLNATFRPGSNVHFSCAELNTYFGRPKWLSSTVNSEYYFRPWKIWKWTDKGVRNGSFSFHVISIVRLRTNGRNNSCWELLANNVASVSTGLKVWPVSNFAQQHRTTVVQQSVQTDATCNIQQCWELLVTNVAFVCT